MPSATVPVCLIESEAPVDCDVEFTVSRGGNIEVFSVAKPVSKSPLTYADIQVSDETLASIESWLYDNWSEY